MAFRISTNRYLKENDLTRKPVEVKKQKEDDTLEALFEFSEDTNANSKPTVETKQTTTKNNSAATFSIKNQRRGMEDFI